MKRSLTGIVAATCSTHAQSSPISCGLAHCRARRSSASGGSISDDRLGCEHPLAMSRRNSMIRQDFSETSEGTDREAGRRDIITRSMQTDLPGHDLIAQGLDDLVAGAETAAALLVSIGAPRLRQLGLQVADPIPGSEHRLYELLRRNDPDSAHSRYNALLRRLVSFERAWHARASRRDTHTAVHEGAGPRGGPVRTGVLTGGATAVLYGWRESTIDVDTKRVADLDRVFRTIPEIKERLQINIELASPDDFIPVREGWEDRSPFIVQEGQLVFRHFDLYAQALSKIERGHAQDEGDVRALLDRDLVDRVKLLEYFSAIEPRLYRYPAIDPSRVPASRGAGGTPVGPGLHTRSIRYLSKRDRPGWPRIVHYFESDVVVTERHLPAGAPFLRCGAVGLVDERVGVERASRGAGGAPGNSWKLTVPR